MREVRHSFKVMTYDVDFAGVVSNIVYVRWLEDLRNLFAEQTLLLAILLERGSHLCWHGRDLITLHLRGLAM